MSIEQQLADFVCTLQARDVPADAQLPIRLAFHPQRPGRLFAWPAPMAVDNHVVVV